MGLCSLARQALDSPLKKGYGGTSRCDVGERRGERVSVRREALSVPTRG